MLRRDYLQAVGAEIPAGGIGLFGRRPGHGVGGRVVFGGGLHRGTIAAVIGHAIGHHPRRGPGGETAQSVRDGLPVDGQMEGQPDVFIVKGRFQGVQNDGACAGDRLRGPDAAVRQGLQGLLRQVHRQGGFPGLKGGVVRRAVLYGGEAELGRTI